MRKILMALFFALLFFGCSPSNINKETLLKIDSYSMSSEEVTNELSSISAFQRMGKTKEELLEEIIEKKILLLEAQREGLDKEAPFMKMVERFWEQSLLRSITEKKLKEFGATARLTKKEREKVNKRFEEWLDSLRKRAKIFINKKAFEKITLQQLEE